MRTLVSWGRSLLLLLGLAVLAGPASAVTIDWVFVGDPGNPADTASNCFAVNCGSVPYAYSIAKFPVTNAQYAEFLNTKAAADPLGLYNTNMGSSAQGGITRSGTIGSYTYAVKPGFANKPVNFVSFYDALRFVNWLGNGQGGGDTEDGAYTLLGGTPTPSNGQSIVSNRGTIFLPSENEWYKAAYHDPATGGYFAYPARSNTQTVCAAPGATPNTANCNNAVGGVTDVGAYMGSASPNGTFDQGGNVSEWNEEIVGGSDRGFRGGSWLDVASGLAASGPPGGADPSNESGFVGFRVASLVPEPSTSLPAVIALAGLAARQARRKRNL
jgi:formylglycine-generating enzyme